MPVKLIVAFLVFALGVFLVSATSIAVLNIRKGGLDFRGVFAGDRFAVFAVAATVWSLAGLVYLIQAASPGSVDLPRVHGPVVVAGWSTSLALWLAGFHVLGRRR